MEGWSRRGVLAGGFAAPLVASRAFGQSDRPSSAGPIRLVVPFPPGGSVDALANLVQPGLQQRLGASVLIEHEPGGSGSVATGRVARSAPDGTSWVFVVDTHAVNPSMQQIGFDSRHDLEPVMLIGTAPLVLVTPPAKPYRTLADVVAASRGRSEPITYASTGIGSLGHIAMVRLARLAGIRLSHVPYRGGGPALHDALAGHVELLIGSAALIHPQLEAKSLIPIAQFGDRRVDSVDLEDVPTVGEAGYSSLRSIAWFGVFAPHGTSRAIVERFGAALTESLADPHAAHVLRNSRQLEVVAAGPDAFAHFVDREITAWGAVVRDNDIKADS